MRCTFRQFFFLTTTSCGCGVVIRNVTQCIRIIEHILRTRENENTQLSEACLLQDNAGCYHGSFTLGSCNVIADQTGIKISRVDFSDPQDGKGAFDRKAASIKVYYVRRRVNEGHDVTTAREFAEAMMSSGGIKVIRVALVDYLLLP